MKMHNTSSGPSPGIQDRAAPAFIPFPAPLFPARNLWPVVRFWAAYWFWFVALLPWMLLRQLVISIRQLWLAWRTRGRSWTFLDGRLTIGFVGSWELLVTAGMFGERLTWLRWDGILIDPGPVRMRDAVQQAITPQSRPSTIVCTHWHEEHIGNAAWFGTRYGVPVLGADATIAAIRNPAPLPGGRHLLMGQAEAMEGADLQIIGDRVGNLEVITAHGHCQGHIVLFDRQDGVLFAGDAFLHELFTSPNADTDHRAWIETLERLTALPVRTLIGAHDGIITCDVRLPAVPGVVRRADPTRLIADKLAFLRWARSVVEDGEGHGVSYGIIEATLFPWQRTWSWRTWFHDEGFRLLTCGEFSRTHLVRSLSATPGQVPVRFPSLLRLGRLLAELAPVLLRIHLLAGRMESVLVIAGSILLSALGLMLAVPGDHGMSWSDLSAAAGHLVDDRSWLRLGLVVAGWTWWWAVLGGAITRRMALAIIAAPPESWSESLRWCARPGLLAPSALASASLLMVALAPRWPWLLVGMPVVWLVAGILYAGVCLPPGRLDRALLALGQIARRPGPFLRRQALFLLGFAVSTGFVYLLAGLWCLGSAGLGGGWRTRGTLLLSLPALVYALGYTTANLKALQIWLFLQRDRP